MSRIGRDGVGRRLPLILSVAMLLAACNGEDVPDVETARVVATEVVETVVAAAELRPAGQVTVTAPAGGEIVELHVEDGDEVSAGDPLVRLRSDNVELQIAQARAALESADAMTDAAGASGVDISPLFGAVRGQLETVLPPLISSIERQADAVEDDELRAALEQEAAEARASYEQAVADLRQAEQESSGQAQTASESQRRAAEAQREQARLALEAVEDQEDELTLVATSEGVVELDRVGGGAGGGLQGLAGSLSPEDLAALEDLPGADGAGPGGGSAGADEDLEPVEEGVSVAAGEPLLTVYDLSDFTVRVEVDEIDAVEVEEGQRATVRVDAYPDEELDGRVTFVALSPARTGGGALFPVTVGLGAVPDEVRLRVGLTASAEIVVREVEGETVVPTAALLRLGRDDLVRVIRDGVVHDVEVEVEALGDELAAVTGDLEVDERVVTTGVDQVADGDELS